MLLQEEAVQHDPTVASGSSVAFAILRLPDGSFAFYDRGRPGVGPLTLKDRAGREHTLLPALPEDLAKSRAILDSRILANTQAILTPRGEVVSVFVKSEMLDKETAARIGLPRYLDVWMRKAGPEHVSEAKRIWRGYNGSQMEYEQLPSGRLLVPHGSFIAHAQAVPPHGRHEVVINYSDDQGETWTESASKLVAPCYEGYNGSNEGACEPAIERLRDGRIWMLMRAQAGFLYESFSHDDGATWEAARASRFYSSTGPPNILRHRDGSLIVAWNNCELPPRHEGQGVYGGRDALHIAVSQDDGRTWRGFQEIYLDHRRDDNPSKSGDRGTAYPLGAFTADGKIVMIAGQGAGGRNPILIDPAWILATEARTDFSDGLAQWSVYKHTGPVARWWRGRAPGARLEPHPGKADAQVLHVRKADDLAPDGAVWNFPNGWKGTLTARVMIREGGRGGVVSLNDRFFDPVNDAGEDFAVFQASLGADGRFGEAVLQPGKWHELVLEWDLDAAVCRLRVDGAAAGTLPLRQKTLNGISYVRFRSAAREQDEAGFFVESVATAITDPHAPACRPEDQAEQERRYVEQVVPAWAVEP